MSAKFNYDIVTLIELIEAKPCLWDKFCDSFKDKIEKKNAWKEVFTFLEKDFEDMEQKKQEEIGNIISTKWQNIRDSFARSLKKKSGQGVQRKYIYNDQLQFLLKILNKDTTVSSIPDIVDIRTIDDNSEDDEINNTPPIELTATSSADTAVNRTRPNVKKKRDSIEEEILKKLKESSPPPDEDEAFFNSVTPSVRNMSEDEKIEFRMGVLHVIQKIKRQRHLDTASSHNMHSPSYSSTSSDVSQTASPQAAPRTINPSKTTFQ